MAFFGRRNVRKHREIKNGEKNIILDISSKLDCMENREFTYSESKDYMGRPDKGLTTYMDPGTKGLNNKKGNISHY